MYDLYDSYGQIKDKQNMRDLCRLSTMLGSGDRHFVDVVECGHYRSD